MCNLNMIFRNDRIPDSKLSDYMNKASWESFQRNNDGEGFLRLTPKGLSVKKSLNKLQYRGKPWLIASHQRITTSGNNKKNLHPHESEHFMLEHNGVLYGLGDKDKSDTAYYLDMLEEKYVENNKDVIKAIQESIKEISGRFSIIVYEKSSKKFYYFKESGTSMYILKGRKYTIMSTIKDNLEYGKWTFGLSGEIRQIKENIIYDVLDNFKAVDKFEEKEKTKYYPQNQKLSSYGENDEDPKETKMFGDLFKSKDKREETALEYLEYEDEEGNIELYPEICGKEYDVDDWRNDFDIRTTKDGDVRFTH